MAAKIILDDYTIDSIVGDYKINCLSERELAKKYTLSFNKIRSVLVENNVVLRTKEECYRLRQEKAIKTCQEKYGVDNPAKVETIKRKIAETEKNTKAKYTEEQREETSKKLSRALQGRKAWNKGLKLGQLDESVKEERLAKQYITKKNNASFNSSFPEEMCHQYLVSIYGESDVFRQYQDPRYPYCCDFYVASKDLFIELNLSWTHGGHVYDEQSREDQLQLARWKEKAKTSNYYENAIITWTERDVAKINCAKRHNLKYLVFYTEEDLYAYFR